MVTLLYNGSKFLLTFFNLKTFNVMANFNYLNKRGECAKRTFLPNGKFLLLLMAVISAVSCYQEHDFAMQQMPGDVLSTHTRLIPSIVFNDSLMVLGPQLQNPYALAVMQQARLELMQENPNLNIPELTTSHIYARFAPANDGELYALLQDTTVHFYDFPLDREIWSGVYYHDPTIVDSLPTYQYVSIPIDKWVSDYENSEISHEVIENLFIPEDAEDFWGNGGFDWGGGDITPIDPDVPWIPAPDPGTIGPLNPNSTSSIDNVIDMLVDRAMFLTGNSDNNGGAVVQSVSETNSSSVWTPSGCITAYDDIVGGPVPLEGVKVLARRWFTTHTGFTDEEGNFTCDGTFKKPANYCIKWERAYWDIRSGNVGQAYYNGPKQTGEWVLFINNNAGKSLGYATIHRAAHRLYYKNVGGLITPKTNKKIKIAYHHKDGGVNGVYYNDWWHHSGIAPMIKIYGFNGSIRREPSKVFSTFCHELAGHGIHSQYCDFFSGLSTLYKEAWARCAQYYLTLIEYEELGYLHNLNIYSAYNTAVYPDHYYNFQDWNVTEDANYPYLPIFIDILDNYNQKDYVASDDVDKYPDDVVYFPYIYSLQNMIFTSSTFAQVKGKLLEFNNPLVNVTEESLTKLFDYYEY